VSEPKRYERCYHKDYIPEGMEEHYNGKWVKWEDYARLKVEVDRLAKCEGYHYTAVAVSMLKEQLQQKHIDYVESRKANEANVEMIKRLTAQVERLTKAGDAMKFDCLDYLRELEKRPFWFPLLSELEINHKSVQAWNAAKEGKQS
jgi:hypothetical protein